MLIFSLTCGKLCFELPSKPSANNLILSYCIEEPGPLPSMLLACSFSSTNNISLLEISTDKLYASFEGVEIKHGILKI